MTDQTIGGRYVFVVTIPEVATIGYFTHCSGLQLSFEVFEYREGGNNDFVHRLPGVLTSPNLILSRGLTNEDALQKWFWTTKTSVERKEIILTLKTPDGDRVWTFADAYPVRWEGPTFDSETGDIATETLEIAHSGLKMG